MKLIKAVLKILLIVLLALSLCAAAYYFFTTKDVTLSADKLSLTSHSITVYDDEGEALAIPSGVLSKEAVVFHELSPHTVQAFVATEDKRFFQHKGFDLLRIGKSVLVNLKARSFRQGASTISQQLVKNTHLSHEKTLARKLKEFKLTRQLEKQYEKEEIFEKYVSVIYFGHNCFGLRAACAFYFDKQPNELNLAESAVLAGLVKSPNNFSPFLHPEACAKRKATVLQCMQKNDYITDAERKSAMEYPLPVASPSKTQTHGFVRYVFEELSSLAEAKQFPIAGKLEIDTYLDEKLQTKATVLIENTQTDATVAVLDVDSRGVKAYASSVGRVKRLPGSLLKPLLVYAPALEENLISPATPLLDEPIRYGGYAPHNYDGNYHGYVSAREALSNSFNIPAVKLLNTLGIEKATEYLQKMGLHVTQADKTLALALGGMQHGYDVTELLSAYAVFPNGGTYAPSAFIKRIRLNGELLYERQVSQKQVFSKSTAYLTGSMLQTAAKTGTAKKLRTLEFDVAAKTGTAGTQNGNTDAYAFAYTMRDIVGVWQGNAEGGFISATGGGQPCNLALEILTFLQNHYNENNMHIPPFTLPTTVQHIALDKHMYEQDHTLALADELSPPTAKIYEYFQDNAIPRTKSELYSNPKIEMPKIAYQDGSVQILFHNHYGLPYTLEITRTDYQTKHCEQVYKGDMPCIFKDDTVLHDKKYLYTITPIYNERRGESVTLPAINTKPEEKTSPHDQEIIEKDWWEY